MALAKIVGCIPTGSTVLVEHLTDQEIMGTSMILPGKSKGVEVQQSVVLAVGPAFDTSKWGFNVGDRVLVVGSYNPVPNYGELKEGRERGIVEPHAVRGVLKEDAA